MYTPTIPLRMPCIPQRRIDGHKNQQGHQLSGFHAQVECQQGRDQTS